MSGETRSWYRPEIDGLRAVAVLPVIAFHAKFESFAGGYVGVDVFFVISGYLITTILLRELRAESFSLLRFYERRARRILPALSALLLLCIPFAWLTLTPNELFSFFRAIGATAIFSSNFLFWRNSGYFEDVSDTNPLLHMWSLAVEEQYYLVFPLFLAGVMKLGRRWLGDSPMVVVGALAGVGAASYAWMEWALRNDPSGNFYLAPSRVWELIVGALCAVIMADRRPKPSTLVSALGLLMIAWSVFRFDETTPFPSALALLPVLGTAFIIVFADATTWTARALSAKALVGIGLISYSTYLWHLPLYVFARLSRLERLTMPMNIGLFIASLVLGYLSWRFVEQPFRKPASGPLTRQNVILGLAALSIVGFLGIAAVGHLSGGFPQRFALTETEDSYLTTMRLRNPEKNSCQVEFGTVDESSYLGACQYGDPTVEPSIAVLGDSHSPELAFQLAEPLQDRNLSARLHAYGGCGPLDDPTVSGPERASCAKWSEETFEAIRDDDAITTVVVAYKLAALLDGSARGHYPDMPNDVPADVRSRMAENTRLVVDEFAAAGKQVIFIPQAPEIPKRMVSMTYHFSGDDAAGIPGATRAWWDERRSTMGDVIATFDSRVRVVDATDLLCDDATCWAGRDGVAYYTDDNHLSLPASDLVAAEILAVILGGDQG